MAKSTQEERIQEKLGGKTFTVTPKGHRVLVRPLKLDKEHSIALLEATLESDRLGNTLGEIIAIGDLAWRDLGGSEMEFTSVDEHKFRIKNGAPWAKVGDIILYQRYAGARVMDPMSLKFRDDMVVVNDQDVIAVVTGFEEYEKEYNKAKEEVLAEIRQEQEELRKKTQLRF